MCKRLPSALRFCGMVIVPALALMFAAPASAQVGSTGSGSAASSESQGGSGNILVTIDKSRQKMTVVLDGVTKYEWPVSTGKGGYSTPSGSYTATSMNEIWYSKEWDNAPCLILFSLERMVMPSMAPMRRSLSAGPPRMAACVFRVRMPQRFLRW